MARLEKGLHFRGTVGDLVFYQRWGTTYVRTKGSVTRERVLKNREYATTRQYANKMALASRIASPVYRALPADRRARWIFRTITGDAASLLYKGMNEKEVADTLWQKYLPETEVKTEKGISVPVYNPYSSTKEEKKRLRKLFLDRWIKQNKCEADFKQAWHEPKSFDPETVRRISDPYGFLQYAGNRRE
jgi:hypothetical protein